MISLLCVQTINSHCGFGLDKALMTQFIGDKMAGCEPWKSQSPAEMDNAMEAMEKLVMNRLYN
jgi:hypothetical protein